MAKLNDVGARVDGTSSPVTVELLHVGIFCGDNAGDIKLVIAGMGVSTVLIGNDRSISRRCGRPKEGSNARKTIVDLVHRTTRNGPA